MKKFDFSQKSQTSNIFLFPRICIMVNEEDNTDRILIDNDYNVLYRQVVFKMGDVAKEELINLMPADLKDNWRFNKPGR